MLQILENPIAQPIFFMLLMMVIMQISMALFIKAFYRAVPTGHAIVRTGGQGEIRVSFSGMTVIPLIHIEEYIDVSLKLVDINFEDNDRLVFQAENTARIWTKAYVRIQATTEAVTQNVTLHGAKEAGKPETVNAYIQPKMKAHFQEAAQAMTMEEAFKNREVFKERIMQAVGDPYFIDSGYEILDLAIYHFERN